MSVQNPANKIARWSVEGMEGMFVKMFDPPNGSPDTPDRVAPTNPVPEVMAAAGFQEDIKIPHTVQRSLAHGLRIPTWDGLKDLEFFALEDDDNSSTSKGTYPGAAIRVPRGVVFHCETHGQGQPPHTIHWHGIEPTPMNDGVGHCSLELGTYIYQFQPNFIGTYFYHCHRNTMQHFEFGLFGMLLVDPPDAYFATEVDVTIPIGCGRDGRRRTAANLADFPQFQLTTAGAPDPTRFNSSPVSAPDPWTGDSRLKFLTDPHAMTVVYDLEALWVFSARDSVWSDMADDGRQTFPVHGSVPGVNDNFHTHGGAPVLPGDFFAFNDYNADYWYVTGIPVRAHKGETERNFAVNAEVPPGLNSGVTGTQVPINAQTGQTVLLRCLDAAYNSCEVTFPINVVIIAWDGRALGVAPYGHNEAYLVEAGTPIVMSTARRFDCLIRSATPVDDFAVVKMINTRGQVPGENEEVLVTIEIPIHIGGDPQQEPVYRVEGKIVDPFGLPLEGVLVTVTSKNQGGSARQTGTTSANGDFRVEGLINSSYEIMPSLAGFSFAPEHTIVTINDRDVKEQNFTASLAVGAVSLSASKLSPQPPGIPHGVTFTATVVGGAGPFEYQYHLSSGGNTILARDFATDNKWTWDTLVAEGGTFSVLVHVRQAGASGMQAEKIASTSFVLSGAPPTFTPNSYSLEEALDALRMNVGLKNPTLAETARLDVAPFLNGVVQPDGLIDLKDVLNILRMAVGLTPL